MSTVSITAFYAFVEIPKDDLDELSRAARLFCDDLGIRGLILLAHEGINGTIAGSPAAVARFKEFLFERLRLDEDSFKDSFAHKQPFNRMRVRIKPEIVDSGCPDNRPSGGSHKHVSPKQWHQLLSDNEECILLDTRNKYETKLGMFKGALDPNLETFDQFGKWIQECGLAKDKKILMYCTGGIRCEKAILQMEQAGFNDVNQLQGGILKYLEEYPQGHFNGECFVFDHRVAVDANLAPSRRYRLCPHCGDPGECNISCNNCSKAAVICADCAAIDERVSCSKNCAYHLTCKKEKVKKGKANSVETKSFPKAG